MYNMLYTVYLEPIWPIWARWPDGYEKKPDGESSIWLSRWVPSGGPMGFVHLFPSGHLAYVDPHSPQAQISFSPMFVPGGLMGLIGMLGPMGQMDLFGPMVVLA